MTDIIERDEFLTRLHAKHRPGADKVLAFYDHGVGAICRDGASMYIPLDDHLVHRGDGVFDTMKFEERKIYQLGAHIERLQRSASAIYLTPPVSYQRISELCKEVARAAESDSGMIRVFLGRGPGGFGIDPSECPMPSLYVVCSKLSKRPESQYEQGVTAMKSSIPAKQSWLAQIKSIDYLPNMLIKREAGENGVDFGVCFDEHGFLAEGAIENVICVDQDGVIIMPDLKNVMRGTTMMRALDMVGEEYRIQIRPVSEDEMYDMREIIVVGTTLDAMGVVRFNGKPIHDVRPGPVAKRLRELLLQDVRENGDSIDE